MFISFASCLRRRSSGTGKNEPLASLYPVKGSRSEPRGNWSQAIPPIDASFPHAGLKEETAT